MRAFRNTTYRHDELDAGCYSISTAVVNQKSYVVLTRCPVDLLVIKMQTVRNQTDECDVQECRNGLVVADRELVGAKGEQLRKGIIRPHGISTKP